MQLGATTEYRAAFDALNQLKADGVAPDQLKAIAAYLLFSHDGQGPESRFPYRGLSTDPRDRDVVEAYRDAWSSFIEGDD